LRALSALVVRIFLNPQSCLLLFRALAVEIHENWIEAARYLKHGSFGRDEEREITQGGCRLT